MRNCHQVMSGAAPVSRRVFVRTATLGGGAALFTAMAPVRALAAGHCEALLLTCMDYRLENELLAYMDGRRLRDNYDHVVLAGASLGTVTHVKPAWREVFLDHLATAQKLHGIKKVIVIDHRDCGAYRLFLGADRVKTPELELQAHTAELHKCRELIQAKAPGLDVELGLMGLDGKVETVG